MRWRSGAERLLPSVGIEPLEEEDAVEVVELVLEAHGRRTRRLDLHLVAVEVDPPHEHTDFGRTISHARPGTDRHPSSKTHSPSDSSIVGFSTARAPSPSLQVVDEQPLLDTDLRGRQPDTRPVVHRDRHVVDESDEGGVDVGDVLRRLLQDGVAEHPDVVGRRIGRRLPFVPRGAERGR